MTTAEKNAIKELTKALNAHIEDSKGLNCLIELVPDIQQLVKDRQDQEVFNKKAAKIGRFIVVIAGAIGALLGAAYAVSKLIVTLGE